MNKDHALNILFFSNLGMSYLFISLPYPLFVKEIIDALAQASPTWKEEKKRSMKSLASRRPIVALVDSSVTKIKTT